MFIVPLFLALLTMTASIKKVSKQTPFSDLLFVVADIVFVTFYISKRNASSEFIFNSRNDFGGTNKNTLACNARRRKFCIRDDISIIRRYTLTFEVFLNLS